MKKCFLFLTIVLHLNISHAQLDSINTSNIRAVFIEGKGLWNIDNGINYYPALAIEGKTVIYASTFWMGGKDANDSLKIFANKFNAKDLQAGPVMMDPSDYSYTTAQYNKVYKVTRNEIYWHQSNFNTPGYTPSQSIVEWPGNPPSGSVGGGLAPYHDYNLDNNYNPYDGDFPLIKGDESIFMVFNDDTVHTSTGSISNKTEIHLLAYIFNCTTDSVLQNSLFTEYTIYNRGGTTLFDAYFGVWNDFDLGFPEDDFVGTDVQNGMIYTYNGDYFDEASASGPGFGSYPPAVGMLFLAGPFQISDNIDNQVDTNIVNCIAQNGIPYSGLGYGFGNSIIDDEQLGLTHSLYYYRNDQSPVPAQTEPVSGLDFYNYMSGKWKDSSNVYFGGTGHQSSAGTQSNGLVPSRYIFPGYTDTLLWSTAGVPVPDHYAWSEYEEANNPADRRMLGSSGPFIFNPGERHTITTAYLYARDFNDSTLTASVDKLGEYAEILREYYKNDSVPCYGSFTVGLQDIKNETFDLTIYPNPASREFTIILPDQIYSADLQIYDTQGKLIFSDKNYSGNYPVPVHHFEEGIYLVKIVTEGYSGIKKLSVMR